MQPGKLSSLCKEKSLEWDNRIYFKKHHSNGMCVKVLFEILSKISPIHKAVYSQIKKIIWSHYLVMINGDGLIKEFEKYGMSEIKVPREGAFIFLRQGNIIGHVGLCESEEKFWHMGKKGFVCEDIKNYDIAYIGVF